MSGVAITMMVVICGIVWGGFALLISRAIRKEAMKSSR